MQTPVYLFRNTQSIEVQQQLKEIDLPKIITIKDLLSKENLVIPEYQRPYKWSIKNVNQLIDDILLHQKKSAYRIGTLVVHEEIKEGKTLLNIVDGQQRAITLSLIAHAIITHRKELLQKISSDSNLHSYASKLLKVSIRSDLSKFNIQNNYQEIVRRIRDFNVEAVYFFFEHCQLVQVILTDISEAFQFFDSQNSRGKDLEPHDLLKAFHLRAMSGVDGEDEKMKKVAAWEEMKTEELGNLFGNYLYRIRNWSKGYSARYFSKEEADVFKGITIGTKEYFPFTQIFRIGNNFTDDYNQHIHRGIDGIAMPFPFQIDQVIINGKRFFEMVPFYNSLLSFIHRKDSKGYPFLEPEKDTLAIEILDVISNYEGVHRVGDGYVRTLFDCSLLYYLNKFGTVYFGKAIEKFFIWAYSLRLSKYAVQIASIDNHALDDTRLFQSIRESIHPMQVINIPLGSVTKVESTKTSKIEELFKKMNYINA